MEGMFYLMMHSTHFIYVHMVSGGGGALNAFLTIIYLPCETSVFGIHVALVIKTSK